MHGINHKSIHACVVPGLVAFKFLWFLTCILAENHLELLRSLPIAMFEPSPVNTIGPCFRILAFVSQSCLSRPTPSMTSHTQTRSRETRYVRIYVEEIWRNTKSSSIRPETIHSGSGINPTVFHRSVKLHLSFHFPGG